MNDEPRSERKDLGDPRLNAVAEAYESGEKLIVIAMQNRLKYPNQVIRIAKKAGLPLRGRTRKARTWGR